MELMNPCCSCEVYLSNRHHMFKNLTPIPSKSLRHLDDCGVNSDSILVRKEETKAFWEGKMQPLEPEEEQPQVYANNKNQWNGKVERALSPPPGFIDSTDGAEHHEEEPSLSADDYAPVGSITFKGNDVPISDPDRKQQYIFGQQEEVEEEYEEPVVIQTERSVPPPSRPAPRGEYFEPASASSINPTETLIEREIRLQKEREEAVLRERQMALEALEAARKQQQKPSAPVKNKEAPMCSKPAQPPVSLEPVVTASKPVKKLSVPSSASESVISPAEIRISEEIRELKRREEELRRLRESNARNEDGTMPSFATSGVTDDEGLFSDADRDVTSSSSGGSEAASSRVESPEAGQMVSDYPSSKFPHQRTQSMDSMSSGHSSGDHGPTTTGVDPSTLAVKRGARNSHKTVMPLEDPSEQDDTPAYLRVSKETPIEREIRLGREREEALRREKGLQQPNWASSNGSTVSGPKEIRQQDGQRITNGTNGDKRDVQHRLASSIIRKEMNETAERESELKNDGRIITTSVERVDSKVATLADYKKNNAPYQRQGSRIKTQISADGDANKEAEVGARPQPPKNTYSRPAATAVPPTVVSAPPATWRNFSNQQPNSQRGLMEKFLKTRGQMGTPTTFVNGSSGSPAGDLAASSMMMMKPSAAPPVPRYIPPVAKPPIQLITASEAQRNEDGANEEEKPVPSRRHYATTEEKIQQEFREMQKREEELKLNRSKMFKSQPNLLACLDGDEDGTNEPEPSMRSAHSNADLLADEPASMEREGGATVKAGARRKSALIAQWESRIQQDF